MSFFDFITYNGGKGPADGNNYWKKYTVAHWIYIFVMLVLMGVGLGAVSLLLGATFEPISTRAMFMSYFTHPLIALLNILPCVLLVLLFYFISGRAWIAFTVPGALITLMSVGNYYKVQLRNEAVVASDLMILGEAAGIIHNYTLEMTGFVVIALACFAFGVVFSVFLMKGALKNRWVRIIGVVLTLALCVFLYCAVYTSDEVYKKTDNSENINIWSELQVYISKGFLYSFINSIPDAVSTPPEGYDEAVAKKMLSRYESGEIAEDKKVNVISVMFEAYSDLSEKGAALEYDVYAPLRRLREESVSGHIVANVFGGGTIDTERSFLTGYTEHENYRSSTNSHIWYLREQGYYTEGFHTGDDWFYSRENVAEYFGFESYKFLDDYGTTNRSDEFFFDTLTDLYENRDEETPYFNFSVTYQNHGAYDSTATCETAYAARGDLSDYSYNILNNYLEGIADTTERMEDFVDSFRDSGEPVVIVFFGDHMPWLGDGNRVYNELGINIDLGTEEGFYNYYATPYLIWANDAAKETLGNDFSGDGGDISACFLMEKLFELFSWEGSSFMAMNRELHENISVVNTATGYFCENGALTTALSPEAAALMDDYRKVQYYLQHNYIYG